MCRKNGGCYIKIGQHIGALEYLLPSEYVQTFKVFHSDAPQTPIEKLERVIEEELDAPGMSVDVYFICLLSLPLPLLVGTILSGFEKDPLGAASLAQCHKAVLNENGQRVAVKIQHPGVMKNALTDMATVDVRRGK